MPNISMSKDAHKFAPVMLDVPRPPKSAFMEMIGISIARRFLWCYITAHERRIKINILIFLHRTAHGIPFVYFSGRKRSRSACRIIEGSATSFRRQRRSAGCVPPGQGFIGGKCRQKTDPGLDFKNFHFTGCASLFGTGIPVYHGVLSRPGKQSKD